MYRRPSVEMATLVEADDLFRRAAVYGRHRFDRGLERLQPCPVDASFGCRSCRRQLAVDSFFNGTREGLAVLPGEFPDLVLDALGPDQNSHSWYHLGRKCSVDTKKPMLVVADDFVVAEMLVLARQGIEIIPKLPECALASRHLIFGR